MLPRLVGVDPRQRPPAVGPGGHRCRDGRLGSVERGQPDGDATLRCRARPTPAELATSTGPNAVAATKRQLAADMLRHDPAASVADSLRLLDELMGTAEYREGVSRVGREATAELLTVNARPSLPDRRGADRYW